MSALHVKTFHLGADDSSLYADLRVSLEGTEVVLGVRVTRTNRSGKEKPVGFARLNKVGELVKMSEEFELSDKERSCIERAIRDALI